MARRFRCNVGLGLAWLVCVGVSALFACDTAEVADCRDMPEDPSCACDLEMASSCARGMHCAIVLGDPAAPVCASLGTGIRGAMCSTSDDCAVGLTCAANRFGVVSCVEICNPVGMRCGVTDIAGTCASFETPAVIDGVEYGFCALD